MTQATTEEPNAVVLASEASARYEGVKAMVAQLNVEASLAENDTRSALEFQMDIVERILSGETEEEIFEAQEAGGESGKDFINRPFRLAGADLEFVQSQIKTANAFPFYARMRVTEIVTGDEHSITCGGFSVVAVLYALRLRGFLQEDVAKAMTFTAKSTASGNMRLAVTPYAEPKPRGKASAK